MSALKKYYLLLKFIGKYAGHELSNKLATELNLDNDSTESDQRANSIDSLAKDITELGPTFVKFGQIISSQSDFLSAKYIEALSELQDNVDPEDFDTLAKVVHQELGDDAEDIFLGIELEPLASASLAQVHRAELSGGESVVVKVQRPDVEKDMLEDLQVISRFASSLDKLSSSNISFKDNLEILKKSLLSELDYQKEADNMNRLREELSNFDKIIIPKHYPEFSSKRVLTQENIFGAKLTDLDQVARDNFDLEDLADQFFKSYLTQIIKVGFFHADPHPGNVLLTAEGKLALIDFGMVLQLPSFLQNSLAKLVFAIADGRSSDVARITADIGIKEYEFNFELFKQKIDQLVTENINLPAKQIHAGKVLIEISEIADQSGLRLPAQFIVLGKTLVKLDNICQILNPDFDPYKSVKEMAVELIKMPGEDQMSLTWLYQLLNDSQDLVCELPRSLTDTLRHFSTGKFRIDVKIQNEDNFILAIQKVANRISNGIVIAALIIGASLMLDIETDFKLFGYPGLAIIFFVVAFLLGIYSVISSIAGDK